MPFWITKDKDANVSVDGDAQELVQLLSGHSWDELLQENNFPSTKPLVNLTIRGLSFMEDSSQSVEQVRELVDILLRRTVARCPLHTIRSMDLKFSRSMALQHPRMGWRDIDSGIIDGCTISRFAELCQLLEDLPLNITRFSFFEVKRFHPHLRAMILFSLSKNRHLEHFSMDGYESTQILPNQIIPRNPLLRLELYHCHIGNEEASILMRAAFNGKTSKIQCLSLANACVTVLDPEAIALLRSNTHLKHLELSDNRFGDAGAALIADALTVNKRLTHLDMNWCDIGDNGYIAIASALQVNNTLQKLELRTAGNYWDQEWNEYRRPWCKVACNLSEASVRAFVAAFGINRTLQSFTTDEGELSRQLVQLTRQYLLPLNVVSYRGRTNDGGTTDIRGHNFILKFHEICRELREGAIHDDTASFRWILPLLGCKHLLAKRTVLFLMLRQRAEVASKSVLQSHTTPPPFKKTKR
jgi:Leucine Rich repeat